MNLSDLCPICIPPEYDPNKIDEYGDIIVHELCEEEIIEKSTITDILVQQVKQFDTMMGTNQSVFTTKNKLYCGEE